jgi:pSer/pThr/pTyr-binding forkhead associated (FHA) protein
MATIQVVTGVNAGEEHELLNRETLIGRHPECQIVLRDSTVSRRHARIAHDQNGFWVHDLGSQHGTRVNGELLRGPHPLSDRDEILLSQVTIVFRNKLSQGEEDNSRKTTSDRPSTIVTSIDVLSGDTGADESKASPKWKALLDITRSLGGRARQYF